MTMFRTELFVVSGNCKEHVLKPFFFNFNIFLLPTVQNDVNKTYCEKDTKNYHDLN